MPEDSKTETNQPQTKTEEQKPQTLEGSKPFDSAGAFVFYCTPCEGRLRTYQEVAEKFGVCMATVEKYGSRENWGQRRETIRNETTERALEQIKDQAAAEVDQDLTDWRRIKSVARKAVEKEERCLDGTEVYIDSKGKVKKRAYSAYGFSMAVESFDKAVKGMRVAFGMPTEITKGEVTNINKDVPLTPQEIEEMDGYLEAEALKELEQKKIQHGGQTNPPKNQEANC